MLIADGATVLLGTGNFDSTKLYRRPSGSRISGPDSHGAMLPHGKVSYTWGMQRLRVALVNPPPAFLHEPQYDTPEFTRLGLACLAAYLRDRAPDEFDILVLDAKFERLGYDEVDARLAAFRPDVLGLTAFTNEIVPAGEVGARAKKRDATLRVVIGGVHVSALPERTLQEFPAFDIGVVGEGEETFLELLRAWKNGKESLAAIPGLVTPGGLTAPRPRIGDQTLLPRPAWDLLPPSKIALVMTSRGCPFACNFCMNPNGRIVRKRGVDQVLEEIAWLVRERGARHLIFCDEIFTVDKNRAHAVLDGMLGLNFGPGSLTFSAQTHVNCIDEPLLAKMREAGVTTLGFGIETADPEALAQMGKGTNLQKIRHAVDLAKKTNVGLTTYFILGQPNETWTSAWRSLWFAARINPVLPIFGIMVPYPGTKVWQWAQSGERGYRLKSTNWNDFNKQLGKALELEHLSRRQLEVLQLMGYLMVFITNLRLGDLVRFLWRYRKEGVQLVRKIAAPTMSSSSA